MPLLIFDLDGTLLDSRQSILGSIRYALEKIGRGNLGFDEEAAVRQDLATTLKKAAGVAGNLIGDQEIVDFISIYREHHSRDPAQAMTLFPRVRETLEHLSSRFTLAIATTKCTEQASHILQEFQLFDYFNVVQGTDPGLRYKPHPDILHEVLRRTEVSSSHALYMGDSSHDLEAAEAAGMLKIAAAYGYSRPEELAAVNPHWTLNSFELLSSYSREMHFNLMRRRRDRPEMLGWRNWQTR